MFSQSLHSLLAQLEPTSLAQLDAVALLNRTDTKFLLTREQLVAALADLGDQYQVLEIDGLRLSPYQTVYFDTADFALYLRHHAGKRNRHKVRSRRYVATGQSFFEIKLKTNKARTIKRRLPTAALATSLTPEAGDFLLHNVPQQMPLLEPKLWNSFSRITLASTRAPERLTIDVDLSFHADGGAVRLPELAIAEVKQADRGHSSDFMRRMQAMNLHSTSFSKYCIGVSLLHPGVKHNNFKPSLRLIDKLTGGITNERRAA
jgi:hypothetical protein